MLERGIASSRMKDWYDTWLLSRNFAFDPTLLAAVSATLAARQILTPTAEPIALSEAFAADASKLAQWNGFVRKAGIEDAPALAEAVRQSRALLAPVWDGAPVKSWSPGGPWR